MIEKFVCPGCVNGCDTKCGSFDFKNNYCSSHNFGTMNGNLISFSLGLPNGFNRFNGNIFVYENIQEQKENFEFDIFNIPVWYTYIDNYLILKIFSPRIFITNIIIIKDAKISEVEILNKGYGTSLTSFDFNFSYKNIIFMDKNLISEMD